MKKTILSICFVTSVLWCSAQIPAVVKVVESTVTKPSATTQTEWVNNQWNGLFFYQGVGSPTKLCVTDGTDAGTKYLTDIGSGNISAILPAQDFVYIITRRIVSFPPLIIEDQLWKSDGTAAGTSLLYTFSQTGSAGNVSWWSDKDAKRNYAIQNNTMYFTAWDAATGYELWKTDGTTAGTAMVIDLKTGTGNSNPMAFCKLGSEIFFTATAVGLERKLWKTDGTAGGTVQIPVAEPFFIVDFAVGIVNNKMIFYAHNTVDGYEPYVSDGTAAGTFMLKDINAGAGNSWLSQSQNAHLKFNHQHCYFIANNGTANALWRTDGTTTGTIQLTTNAQNVASYVSGGSYTEIDSTGLWMIEYNTSGSGNNEKLYRSNGSVAGTYLVAQNLSYAQNTKLYKGALWMASRNTGSNANTEPWRSGGNAATTNKAFEIAPGLAPVVNTPYSSDPFGFFEKNGKLYFFAKDQSSITKLFQYNGDFTFNGTLAGGKWKDSTNWNSMMPPGITDTVFVNAGTPNILNVEGGNGYAGVLHVGNNASINFVNATDTLFINNRINALGNNTLGYPGVLALKSVTGDTVKVDGGFDINNMDVQSPAAIVSGSILLYSKISFTSGKLFLNNNNFRLNINTVTTANANNYFVTNGSGAVVAMGLGTGLSTQPKLIPIGTAGNYAPVTITNTGDADNFSARVINAVNQNYTVENPSGLPYVTGAVNHTWFINEGTAGGSNASINLQWNAAQELPLFNRTQTYLGHYTGGVWNYGTQGAAIGTDPYSFSRTNITSFSPFGIFNNDAVLPLNFISFSAQKCANKQVCLNWKTSNEQNVSHFEIERSADGLNFINVGYKQANNQSQNTYTATDDINGWQGSTKIYYRIKEVEQGGQTKLSHISLVRLEQEPVLLYPSLVSHYFTVQNESNVKMQLRLLNTAGQLIMQQPVDPGTNTVFTHKLVAGIYLYQVSDAAGLLVGSGKIVKQ